MDDYIDLSDPHSFVLQPTQELSPYCGSDVKILILVASAPKNLVSRNAIRETWGAKQYLWGKGGRLLFMLGRSDNSTIDVSILQKAYANCQ